MQNAIRRGLCAAALTLAMFASASAQDTMRVRGTIERVEGPVYVIKTRDGAELKVALAEPGLVVALVKASMADIKPVCSSARPECRNPTAAKRRSKSTSSPRRCAAPAKGTIPGTCRPTRR